MNCDVGLDIYAGGPEALSVGSVTFFDSAISDTRIGIRTGYTNSSQPPTANSLIVENVSLLNVPIAIENGHNRTQLVGTPARSYIAAYGQGHAYQTTGPNQFQGFFEPVSRPASLLQADGRYYQRSKPQYEDYTLDNVISARDAGVTGNGRDDDTVALQKAIYDSVTQEKVLFVDHGDYLVSSTIHIPAGAKIVGETYSVILSYGEYFNDINNPQAVVRIGKPGETGVIEWTDMIVSTQGQQRGAVLFEYNLNSPSSTPSGIWDVHARIGGFTGSKQTLAECPTTPNRTITTTANSTISANFTNSANNPCIAAYLTFHITPSASGLYMENDWIWTADHDIEVPDLDQITLYTGRGLLVDSEIGVLWFVGTAVEHNVKYEYQFVNTKDIFAGQVSVSREVSTF